MASYLAVEPPGKARDAVPDATVFVRDGFTLFAFLVPLLWFLWHRMWIEAGLALLVMLGLAGLDGMAGMPGLAALVSFLASLAVGFEAPSLRVAALGRRGWSVWGVIEARNHREAELRYVAEAADEGGTGGEGTGMQTPPAWPRPAFPTPPSAPAASGPALGLFDYPGSR